MDKNLSKKCVREPSPDLKEIVFLTAKVQKNNTTWPILITVVRIIPGDGAALMQAFGFCARCVHNS